MSCGGRLLSRLCSASTHLELDARRERREEVDVRKGERDGLWKNSQWSRQRESCAEVIPSSIKKRPREGAPARLDVWGVLEGILPHEEHRPLHRRAVDAACARTGRVSARPPGSAAAAEREDLGDNGAPFEGPKKLSMNALMTPSYCAS